MLQLGDASIFGIALEFETYFLSSEAVFLTSRTGVFGLRPCFAENLFDYLAGWLLKPEPFIFEAYSGHWEFCFLAVKALRISKDVDQSLLPSETKTGWLIRSRPSGNKNTRGVHQHFLSREKHVLVCRSLLCSGKTCESSPKLFAKRNSAVFATAG